VKKAEQDIQMKLVIDFISIDKGGKEYGLVYHCHYCVFANHLSNTQTSGSFRKRSKTVKRGEGVTD
jgi:hypothetical protein